MHAVPFMCVCALSFAWPRVRRLQACIVFFDEVDAIGGTRFDDASGGDSEVQRTMLEIVNQLVSCRSSSRGRTRGRRRQEQGRLR